MGFPGSVLLNQGDIYKQTSDKRYPLGTRGYTRDGRIYKYAKCGVALTAAGQVCQCAVPPDSANWAKNLKINAVPTSNSTSILITATTACATKDYFADGYLWVDSSGGGGGQMVQIKSQPVMTSGATAQKIKFYEEDKIITAVTTARTVGMVPNRYRDVIVKPATPPTSAIVGVNPMAITASYYFWIQTWGPCPVKETAALDLATPVCVDSAAAGGVQKLTTGTTIMDQQIVGYCLAVGDGANNYGLVDLKISA